MPTLREELAADTAAAIAIYGQTFQWKGNSYPCTRRDQPTFSELEDGGYREGVTYFLTVAKAAFTGALPQFGDLVDNSSRQIKRVVGAEDPAAVQLLITVGSIDG